MSESNPADPDPKSCVYTWNKEVHQIVYCLKLESYQKLWLIYSDFVLPSVSIGVGETIGEEEDSGWQPILATSLQQLFQKWHFWSQKHPLLLQFGDRDSTQHPE